MVSQMELLNNTGNKIWSTSKNIIPGGTKKNFNYVKNNVKFKRCLK